MGSNAVALISDGHIHVQPIQSGAAVAGSAISPSWSALIRALEETLGCALHKPTSQVEVVIASAWMRYLVVPWNERFQKGKSFLAWVGSAFNETFGEAAQQWTIQYGDRSYRQPVLAVGLDTDFLNAVLTVLASHQLTPKLIQPDLVFAYQLHRASFTAPMFWFVLRQPGTIGMLLHDHGAIQAVRVEEEGSVALEALIERAERSLGLETDHRTIYLATATPTERRAAGQPIFSLMPRATSKPRAVAGANHLSTSAS